MKKVYLICNAHIDPVWQWEWEEGISSALSTFQSAVNLAKDFDYIFCHNEAILYNYIEKYAPALFEQIKELVKAGKWHIMGGWYLQPDVLIPDGEGIVRQIKEGELYFKKNFGVMPSSAIGFDAFGHSKGLVQIIKKCGQENYMFVRPYGDRFGTYKQLDLPNDCFTWEGYDGSQIKAIRIPGYNSGLGHSLTKINKDVKDAINDDYVVSAWGVGNHGGGPSRKDLQDIEKFIKKSEFEVVHSTPDIFFNEVKANEVIDTSLISCMPGCYSSMLSVKQGYRNLEKELYFAEKIASIASLKCGVDYSQNSFNEVINDLLNVQFHDILSGTVIRSGEVNALNYINHGMHILNQIRAHAFFCLIKGEPTAKPNTFPIFVFNPKTYEGKQYVECELSIIPTTRFRKTFSNVVIVDEKGNEVPCQTIKEDSNQSVDFRKRVIFEGNLSPLNITRFTAVSKAVERKSLPTHKSIRFDNECKKVFINARTGLLESYIVDGVEYANGKLFEPYCYDDNADPWAMSKEQLFKGIGKNPKKFNTLKQPDGIFKGLQSFEIIEDGDIYIAAEAFFGFKNSRLRIGYKVYKKGSLVDIDVSFFPGEINKVVKLHLPLKDGNFIGEQMFGREELYRDGRECVAQNYVASKIGNRYLELITPNTNGSSYKDNVMKITLHRSSTYCAHPVGNRPLLRENMFIPKIDQNECTYHFRLCICEEEQLQKNALEFIEKPYALNVFPTIDIKNDNGFEIKTDNPNIRVVTIKKSQEFEGYVIRLQNNTNKPSHTNLTCGRSCLNLNFGKFEVKTVKYDGELIEQNQILI